MIKPIGMRVLVKPLEDSTKLIGGIVRPQSDDMKPMRGEIIAIGEEMEAKHAKLVGVEVYYPRYTGAEVDIAVSGNVIKFLIIEYEDLLGFEIK